MVEGPTPPALFLTFGPTGPIRSTSASGQSRLDAIYCCLMSGVRSFEQVQYFARAFQQMRNSFTNTVVTVMRDVSWFILLLLVRPLLELQIW